MKKGVEIKQHDITDCGAACLASIAAFYGLQMPIAKIRQLASTDRKGTNGLGMIKAAESIGFSIQAAKAPKTPDGRVVIDPLYKIPKPAILHVILENGLSHYVVIYGISKSHVKIMDPGIGRLENMKLSDFAKIWTGYLFLLVPDNGFKKGSQKISITRRFLFLLKPYKKMIVQAIFGAVVYTVLGLTTSIYLQKIIDHVIPNGNMNLLNLLSVVMIAILFLSLFVNFVKSVFMVKTGMQIDARLILGYYKHLLRLPQTFFDNMRSGEVISRINDAVKIRLFINETLVSLLVNIFTVVFAFAMMFTYYWKLATIILLIIPIYFLIYMLYNRVNRVVQRKIMENAAELQAQLVESINTAGTIKRFGMEEYADMKTENRFITFLRTSYRSYINSLWASSGSEMTSKIFTIILLWSGTYFVLHNSITPGELLSFYALIGYFVTPISSLVNVNKVFQDAKIAADRLFEIMDMDQEEEAEGPGLTLTKEQCGDIKFTDVSFSYGTRVDVFKNLNILFEQGKISAIVGESGSGKTTLAALLQNLYPLNEGNITIGNLNIKHIRNEDLRELVCVIPQKIDLFEGSVAENIILDDYDPDWTRIVEICKEVGILDFIEKLPNGFNTNIGENGVQLSGGQRQRIAIVRALYRNPEILILDEATSALDSESERNIKHIVNKLREQGKTVLLIAHRLGTVMNADMIYVLKEGELIEQGKHNELIDMNGYYAQFWKSQTDVNA